MTFKGGVVVFASLLLMLSSVCQVHALGSQRSRSNPRRLRHRGIFDRKTVAEAQAAYDTPLPFTFTVPLDHFNASGSTNEF